MRPRLAFLSLPLLAALLSVPFAACQAEGEGKPCDTRAGNSGNDDCQPPLVCTTGLTNTNSPRCCPQDRTTAKTPECSLSSTTFDGSNPSPPLDSSTPDTSSTEASADEGGADGPAEGASGSDAEAGGDDATTSDGPGGNDGPGEAGD